MQTVIAKFVFWTYFLKTLIRYQNNIFGSIKVSADKTCPILPHCSWTFPLQ